MLRDTQLANQNLEAAVSTGLKVAGIDDSGTYGFVRTKMFTSIHHEVPPARSALGCADCHEKASVSCARCHKLPSEWKPPAQAEIVYPGIRSRIDFEDLGYKGDPARVGGRFSKPGWHEFPEPVQSSAP